MMLIKCDASSLLLLGEGVWAIVKSGASVAEYNLLVFDPLEDCELFEFQHGGCIGCAGQVAVH